MGCQLLKEAAGREWMRWMNGETSVTGGCSKADGEGEGEGKGGPPTEGGHVHAKAAWFLKKGRTGGAAAGAATGRGLLHACNTEAFSLPAT